ncbi:MAG: hypothetical protein K2I93_07470, partial [Oscillospiraceae bacterium]|nr:hypothetical protein [Oscillospiraceae bacterium]
MGAKLSLRRNKVLKVFAVLLFGISVFVTIGSTYVTLYLYSHYYYASSVEKLSHDLMNDLCADDMYMLNTKYELLRNEGYFDENTSDTLRSQLYDGFMDSYTSDRTNFFFTISDLNDKVLLSSYESDSQCSRVQVFRNTYYEPVEKIMTPEEYDAFSFPDDAQDRYVQERYIEAVTEPTTEIVNNLDEMFNFTEASGFVMEYDEEGAFIRGVSPNGTEYVIRFDESGIPYAVEYFDTEDYVDVPVEAEDEQVLVYAVGYSVPHTEGGYYISGYVRTDLKAQDHYANVHETVCSRYNFRYVFPVVAAVGVLLAITCLIYLVSSAGYRKNGETACTGLFDKIPFDIFTAALLALAVCLMYLQDFVHGASYLEAVCVTSIISMWLIIILWWLMSLAVRIRTSTLISNNLIAIVIRKSVQFFKKIGGLVSDFLTTLPLIWQAVIFVVCFAI